MPGRGDVGTAVITDSGQTARLQIVESDLVGQMAHVQHRAVSASRVRAIHPDLAESESRWFASGTRLSWNARFLIVQGARP